MVENEGNLFPPIIKRSVQSPAENLTRSLDRILDRDTWTGVPDSRSVAAALRQLAAGGSFSDNTHRISRWPEFVAALIEALEGGTADGWRLHLKRTKSRAGTGFAKHNRDHEIGVYVAQYMDEHGKGSYQSALSAAATKFHLSSGTAAQAYSAYKTEIEEHNRWMDRLRQEWLRSEVGTPRKPPT